MRGPLSGALLAALLAAPAHAEEADVEALLAFRGERGGIEVAQAAAAEGCRLTVVSEEAIPGQPPRARTVLTLWLGDWVLAEIVPHEADPRLARIVLAAREAPLPEERALWESAAATIADHLAAAAASGYDLGQRLDEANRLTVELALRGRAGDFGALAARNFAEDWQYYPGGRAAYAWEPLGGAALAVPAGLATDALAALARLQAAACF